MLEHEAELTPIIEKDRNKTAKARYLDFIQGVESRKTNIVLPFAPLTSIG